MAVVRVCANSVGVLWVYFLMYFGLFVLVNTNSFVGAW